MKELTKDYLRELRQNTTNAEKHLWYLLRAKRLKGYKFRRQHLIPPFVVDFVCLRKKLIVELDGGQHAERCDYDKRRSEYLKLKGYRILRFWNQAVFKQTEGLLGEILDVLECDS